jgi:hypothetical protein
MQFLSGVGAALVFLIGLVMTGITIYGYTNSEIFLDDTASRNSILGVLITADILVLLAALMGMSGIKRESPVLIFIFQIFVIIFTIMFFSLGIAAEVLPGQFFDGNCTNSNNPTVTVANQVTDFSDINLCTRLCPCGLTDNSIKTKYSPT